MARGQTNFTRIYGPADRDVAVPEPPGMLGKYDPAALSEITDHLKAVESSSWTDLKANGQITYPRGEGGNSEIDDASLSILGGQDFRLDVTTPKGVRSIRIAWRVGAIEEADGSKVFLPQATAALGLMAFPQLRAEDLSGGKASVIDDGMATVDGQALHRVALVYPLQATPAGKTVPAAPTGQKVAVDLYFDPTSHLLIKSVDVITLSGAGNQRFLRCTTYGDYRQVNGALIPYKYIQSLNGQLLWMLQLSEVQLGTGLTRSAFIF